jgi:hypothetical protein
LAINFDWGTIAPGAEMPRKQFATKQEPYAQQRDCVAVSDAFEARQRMLSSDLNSRVIGLPAQVQRDAMIRSSGKGLA